MQNALLDEAQTGIKIARRKNTRKHGDDTTLMAGVSLVAQTVKFSPVMCET